MSYEDDNEYEEQQEEETTATADHMKGNFKALYNKKYSHIATMNKQHTTTPEQLFDLAVRYFTWAENNHIRAAETAAFQGRVFENRIHKVRIFTITGFRLFSGYSNAILVKWRKQEGFCDVMDFIDSVVYEQKFQLAANGIVNAQFIGKDIGIDKSVEITIDEKKMSDVTKEELKGAVKDILGDL